MMKSALNLPKALRFPLVPIMTKGLAINCYHSWPLFTTMVQTDSMRGLSVTVRHNVYLTYDTVTQIQGGQNDPIIF
jgi:hypothetical protein